MTTYAQARAVQDAAFHYVEALGLTVITTRPRRDTSQDWMLEVETARPLPLEISGDLEIAGVKVHVWSHEMPDAASELKNLRQAWLSK